MTLPFDDRYVKYDPVVLTSVFDVDFPLFDVNGLLVYVDGVSTEDFSVSATFADGVSTDAYITLLTAVSGVSVEVYGLQQPKRENDVSISSPDVSKRLQQDMDRITASQQEQARDFLGAIKIPVSDGAAARMIETATERANRALAFDSDGDPIAGPTADEISNAQGYAEALHEAASQALITFTTPLALKASNRPAFGVGSIWRAGPHLYQELAFGSAVASAANPDGYHVVTAGGVPLRILRNGDGKYSLNAMAIDDTGSVDCSVEFERLVESASSGDCITWSGTILRDRAASGLDISFPAGVHLQTSPGAKCIQVGYPMAGVAGGSRIGGFTLDGLGGAANTGFHINGSHVWFDEVDFIGGNERIRIYTADYVHTHRCSFTQTGYSVIQRYGYTSNYGSVVGCRFEHCTADNIELNAGPSNPNIGWTISDNKSDDTGNGATTTQTERRFLGVTATKGMTVTNNIVKGTAGDAAFHFEHVSGEVVFSGNHIYNPHGAYGMVLYLVGSVGEAYFNWSNNFIYFTSDYTLFAGDSGRLIYMSGGDNGQISLNAFHVVNESGEDIDCGRISGSTSYNITIYRLYLRGVRNGFTFNNMANRRVSITDPNVKDLSGYLVNLESSPPLVFIERGSLYNCANVWTRTGSSGTLAGMTDVWCLGTTNLDLATCLGHSISAPTFRGNTFTNGATHNLTRDQSYIGGSGAKVFFKYLEGTMETESARGSQFLSVLAVDPSDATNATEYLVRMSRISGTTTYMFEIMSQTDHPSGSGLALTFSLGTGSLSQWLYLSSASDATITLTRDRQYHNHTPALAA